MSFLKRSVMSISRRLGKSIILLILIFMLGSIIAGAISVRGAIDSTEANLRRSMPSLVSLGVDEESVIEEFNLAGEFPDYLAVTTDLVREIGALPYVRNFNYSVLAPLESFNLSLYVPEMEGLTGNWDYFQTGLPRFFDLIGISSANLIHIEEGLISIVGGQMLTDDDINVPNDNGIIPALVSNSFAKNNQLSIGSVFALSSMIRDRNNFSPDDNDIWLEENLFAQKDFQFEIVGLFDLVDRETELLARNEDDWDIFMRQREILNQIYVPNYASENIKRFRFDVFNEMDGKIHSDEDFLPPIASLFILEDPLYIDTFRTAVEPLLPEFIGIDDLSGAFGDISGSMETLQQIADWVLWIAVGVTLFILSLLITLFLRDRRYEMGIYLALGEKRVKIISQILIEVVAVAFVGITLALFAGNIISSGMSQSMLRNALVEESNVQFGGGSFVSFHIDGSSSLEGMGFSFEMTPDEMMEAFDISLNAQVILIIYGIGLVAVVTSTLIPAVYVIRLSPRKVLLEKEG